MSERRTTYRGVVIIDGHTCVCVCVWNCDMSRSALMAPLAVGMERSFSLTVMSILNGTLQPDKRHPATIVLFAYYLVHF